ncbi:MAG: Uma2 family endonuclease [Aggregatilineales bacterium]
MTDEIQVQRLPAPGTPMTATDFANLPETMTRIELINGVVVYPHGYGEGDMAPAPQISHQMVTGKTYALLLKLDLNGTVLIAPVDVKLPDSSTIQPDVLWIAPDSLCVIERQRIVGAPELMVEVISPGSERYDKVDKFRLYEKNGVKEYWIAHPEAKYLEVWQLINGLFQKSGIYKMDESFTSPLLQKVIHLAEIFAL